MGIVARMVGEEASPLNPLPPVSSRYLFEKEDGMQRSKFFDNLVVLSSSTLCLLYILVDCGLMGTKIKEIYKGFKYSLSQIFVVKEREMEIGNPTDVEHVAHIGWEGPSGNAPTWMNELRVGSDFAATSIGNSGSALSP
ncbi:hypothetical protein OROGR_007060 [Orobanche gracilis]